MEARLLEWLLESAPLGVAWYAGGGRVRVNAEAARLAGLSEREVALRDWNRRVVLQDGAGRPLSAQERPLYAALGGRSSPRTRMEVLREDGTRVAVAVQALPWPMDGSPGAVVLVEEVEWALDAERRQSEWLGALGHELNGALQGLSVTAGAASRCMASGQVERAQAHLGSVQQQAAAMGRLVRGFIDGARLGAGTLDCRLEPVPLDLFLRECAERAELTDPRHKVLLAVEEDLWAVSDLDRLGQILVNLFSNAARYANPGLLELGARREGARVLLWLSDEGPGIPAELQPELFSRYRRLPSRVDGAGLGLWLSRELARRMGGDLWVHSRSGGGATFFVSSPAALVEGQAADQAVHAAPRA
jgi:signal transduction histidine kinase